MPALTTKAVSGRYYHGVRDLSVYQRICRGQDVLRIAAEHASDPGDLGQGLYVTKSRDEASMYGHVMAVYARAKNALILDFTRNREAVDSFLWSLRWSLGCPVRGMKDHMDREYDAWESGGEVGPEPPLPRVRMSDRQAAARAWRDYFLSEGIDALSVKGWDLGETLVMFSPENQVTAIDCEDEDDRPLARNAAGGGAAVFLVNDRNEVLLLKRGMTAPWMPGKWNLPGGTVDPGETPIEAAVREAQEEVSVTPRGLSILSVTHHDWGTLHLYVSRRWTGDLKMTWESSDMRWVPIKQAVKFDLVPGILEPMVALERLLR